MRLEQQLSTLGDLGLHLNDGITVDDLLYSFKREDYEKKPFDILLFVLGVEVEREPWGRDFCSSVWNFDTESINSDGDYSKIIHRLSKVAGVSNFLTSAQDAIDVRKRTVRVRYEFNGSARTLEAKLNDDWADTIAVAKILEDLCPPGKAFYFKDNGQSMILFCLEPEQARALNSIASNSLRPVWAD